MSKEQESNVAKTFHAQSLPTGVLVKGTIPGLGPASVLALSNKGVKTVNALVAAFFECERSKARFKAWLQDRGVGQQFAEECATQMTHKLGKI